MAAGVLDVSAAGHYGWRNRPPSARAVGHAWLIDQIEAVHTVSERCKAVSAARLMRPG